MLYSALVVPAIFMNNFTILPVEAPMTIWGFPKIRVPYFGVLRIGILLFRVLY